MYHCISLYKAGRGIQSLDLSFSSDLLCFILQCQSILQHSLCVSTSVFAGTLSVCLTEKFSDPLHAVALQFLSTVFTEETSRRQRVTASNSNSVHETSLSDIVNGPSATQLCELLLQVCEAASLELYYLCTSSTFTFLYMQ